MLTDQELQTLRNLGNEAEAAADEIELLRTRVSELEAVLRCLHAEVTAWRARFPQHAYRPQDDCVALRA